MKIGLHGGNCRGIKVIHELGGYPDMYKIAARKATKMTSFGQCPGPAVNDMRRSNPRGKYDFFNLAAPQETYRERLKRFLDFIKEHREHHIIEVVINANTQKAWVPILEKYGFKEVSKGTNSNTMNTIAVYHLVY